MSVRFSPRALADLDGIRAYLVPLNPQGAERVRTAIAKAIDHCERNPKTGTRTDEASTLGNPHCIIQGPLLEVDSQRPTVQYADSDTSVVIQSLSARTMSVHLQKTMPPIILPGMFLPYAWAC